MMKLIINFLFLCIIFPLNLISDSNTKFLSVSVKYANIRSETNIGSKIVFRATFGTILKVISIKGNWYQVEFKDSKSSNNLHFQGYIHKTIVKPYSVIKNQSTVPEKSKSPPNLSLKSQLKEVLKGEKSIKPDDYFQVLSIEKKMRKTSLAFLSIVKNMQPEEIKTTAKTLQIQKVKVISSRCDVYETKERGSIVIYSPGIGEEFVVLERDDNMIFIKLKDNREGWISETCIQEFSLEKTEKAISFKGIKSSELRKYLRICADLFNNLQGSKKVVDYIFNKYKGYSLKGNYKDKFLITIQRSTKYFKYAGYFYKKYSFENNNALFKDRINILSKISAWGELLIGKSKYDTQFLDGNLDTFEGATSSLSLGANYALTSDSNLSIAMSTIKDVIQTPYKTTNFDISYSMKKKKLDLNSGININSYADTTNNLNNFNRFTLRAGGIYEVFEKLDLNFNYSMLNNKYADNPDSDYSAHRFSLFADSRMKNGKNLIFRLNSTLESSDSPFHQFTEISPSITLLKENSKKRNRLKFQFKNISFKELEIRDYSKFDLSLYNRKREGEKSRFTDLGVSYKKYPNNNISTYYQFRGKIGSSKFGKSRKHSSISAITNIMTGNYSNNFTDFKIDFGKSSPAFYNNFSVLFKFWHKHENEDSGDIVKPYILDIYGKIGVNLKYLRIGPTVGVHAFISKDDGVDFIKRDGNLLRFGGWAEIQFNFLKSARFNLNLAYEYGFVYSNQISVNRTTGELLMDDPLMRHPTTLQLNSYITVPFKDLMDIIAKVNYYKIATDMDTRTSINPIDYNNRLVIMLGVRFRYN